MNGALYATIWIALVLFCAGEAGRRNFRDARPSTSVTWAWWAFSCGALLCAIHLAIAMSARYGWSHQAALDATARQTMAVYGLNWGGGVYFNYAFVIAWIVDAWQWRRDPSREARRTGALRWTMRAVFLIMILNAAVIFTGGPRRAAGALIVLWLLWVWRPTSRPAEG